MEQRTSPLRGISFSDDPSPTSGRGRFAANDRANHQALIKAIKKIKAPLGAKDRMNGVVYAVEAIEGTQTMVKVGFSKTESCERIRAIETRCRVPIRRWFQSPPFQHAHRAEHIIHASWDALSKVRYDCDCGHENREWFTERFHWAETMILILREWMMKDPYDMESGTLRPVWTDAANGWELHQKTPHPMSLQEFLMLGPHLNFQISSAPINTRNTSVAQHSSSRNPARRHSAVNGNVGPQSSPLRRSANSSGRLEIQHVSGERPRSRSDGSSAESTITERGPRALPSGRDREAVVDESSHLGFSPRRLARDSASASDNLWNSRSSGDVNGRQRGAHSTHSEPEPVSSNLSVGGPSPAELRSPSEEMPSNLEANFDVSHPTDESKTPDYTIGSMPGQFECDNSSIDCEEERLYDRRWSCPGNVAQQTVQDSRSDGCLQPETANDVDETTTTTIPSLTPVYRGSRSTPDVNHRTPNLSTSLQSSTRSYIPQEVSPSHRQNVSSITQSPTPPHSHDTIRSRTLREWRYRVLPRDFVLQAPESDWIPRISHGHLDPLRGVNSILSLGRGRDNTWNAGSLSSMNRREYRSLSTSAVGLLPHAAQHQSTPELTPESHRISAGVVGLVTPVREPLSNVIEVPTSESTSWTSTEADSDDVFYDCHGSYRDLRDAYTRSEQNLSNAGFSRWSVGSLLPSTIELSLALGTPTRSVRHHHPHLTNRRAVSESYSTLIEPENTIGDQDATSTGQSLSADRIPMSRLLNSRRRGRTEADNIRRTFRRWDS